MLPITRLFGAALHCSENRPSVTYPACPLMTFPEGCRTDAMILPQAEHRSYHPKIVKKYQSQTAGKTRL